MSMQLPILRWCILFAGLCLGCARTGPPADVELKILAEPGKIARIHVRFERDEFDVPADHYASVLEAIEPLRELHTSSKCESIARVDIEGQDAQKLSLILHTHHHPYEFAAHTYPGEGNYIQYVGKDADRLKRTLEAAREAAKATMK